MEKVIVEKSGGIVHVRINRPEVMNACDGETYDAIADAWDDLENDPDLRVGILSGEGRAFCVGTDIKWVKSPGAEGFQDRLYPRLSTFSCRPKIRKKVPVLLLKNALQTGRRNSYCFSKALSENAACSS